MSGVVVRVAGPVVEAEGLAALAVGDVVRVGPLGLLGEVVRLRAGRAVVQVYEETAGLGPGDPVVATGAPLEVELGPGLLGSIFDGVQRPLAQAGPWLERGARAPALPRERVWDWSPRVRPGDVVREGDLLGEVPETGALVHRVLVPPGAGGRVTRVREGSARLEEPVVWLDERPLPMLSRWPVRRRRPVARRLEPDAPIVTGQRVIDLLFPLARGGSATLPGGFGTGKTVLEQALARFADVDVVVLVGCGERGNELTEVLEAFACAQDPRRGAPLMERTVVVANASNMPIAAREASVYTGLTIAEYYRDQGLHVALLADSTSRWAEALREVCARLEELPGEEGYPAYLASRLAEVYERAGAAVCLGAEGREGSVTLIAAVSPPGGDLSEPVAQQSLRLAGTFWALDTDLARRRHFPAIHWGRSYGLHDLSAWFQAHAAPDWEELRRWAQALLAEEGELLEVVQLLGPDALAPAQRVSLVAGRLLREDVLQQSANDPADACCPLAKQRAMVATVREVQARLAHAVAGGLAPERLTGLLALAELGRMRAWPADEVAAGAERLLAALRVELAAAAAGGST